jgi:hypothetical protein
MPYVAQIAAVSPADTDHLVDAERPGDQTQLARRRAADPERGTIDAMGARDDGSAGDEPGERRGGDRQCCNVLAPTLRQPFQPTRPADAGL